MKSNRTKYIFFSLPEIWDFCLEKIYDKPAYVKGFVDVLERSGVSKRSIILDAGCGSGFPAIDLIAKGYKVIGTDKSNEMVRRIEQNAKKRGLTIEAHHVMWSELGKFFGENKFDFVYCRGNSLIYAASWEQNWIVPSRSREEIQNALYNFYQILKPCGTLYLDVTNKTEKPHQKDLGAVKTRKGPVQLTWRIERDMEHRIRTWTMYLKSLKTGEIKKYSSYSYLLTDEELTRLLKEVGFPKIQSRVHVKGENNYDVYLAQK